MVRRTDELAVAWDSLAGDAAAPGWRTIFVTPAGRCRIRAGRRFPGNEEALLVGFPSGQIPRGERLPDGIGFRVERIDLEGDKVLWLAIARTPSGASDLFLRMVQDLVAVLDALENADDSQALRAFLARVSAWQEFMRRGASSLTPVEEIGLVGELMFLSAILDAGVPAATALEAWVGPMNRLQDFELGSGAVEVKSTLAQMGFPAYIGSLEQLDDALRQPLVVAAVRLRLSPAGRTLPRIAADLSERLGHDPAVRHQLEDRLTAAGLLQSHNELYNRAFELSELRMMTVSEDFPRLLRSTVPPGVIRATYEIDLERVPQDRDGVAGALRRTGVI